MFSNTGSTGSKPETECSVGDTPDNVILIVFWSAPVSPFVNNISSSGSDELPLSPTTSSLAASLGTDTCANTWSNIVLSTQDASNVPVISNTLLYASTAW